MTNPSDTTQTASAAASGAAAATASGATPGRVGRLTGALPWLTMLLGLILLARPVLTDWYFAWNAEQDISEITEEYNAMSEAEHAEIIAQADAWNARLRGEDPGMALWDYDHQLAKRAGGTSLMMAWIDIPEIDTRLPVYHGTDDATLSIGVGHCSWSALPVGGVGNRCVLTAHSGMQRTRMFDDIRLLEPGDTFVVWTLGDPYAYRVCDIETILPEEVDHLATDPARDLCTLVTCTPYGVNSHRLLVTGERCEYVPDMGETEGIVPYVNRRTLPLLAGMAVLVALVVPAVVHWRRRRQGTDGAR